LFLEPGRAADLMSPDPMSLRAAATMAEVVEALTARGYSAAPVIDERGRPIGVVSRADVLIHERERLRGLASHRTADTTRAADVMTPAVFSVSPDTPVDKVVEQMLTFDVHQLYVVEDDVLVGVITAHDVLRRLRP
jgi:CBS domain-containing protein